MNSYEWMKKGTGRVEELKLDKARILRAYQQVVEQMCRLNRNAARMTLKYGTHASTDVTGFGILGLSSIFSSLIDYSLHCNEVIGIAVDVFQYISSFLDAPNCEGFNCLPSKIIV